ncbi:hypothetical protein [Caulobacter sp. LARHSG274]
MQDEARDHAKTSGRDRTGQRSAPNEKIIYGFFVAQTFALVFLQKLSINFQSGSIELPFFIMYIGLAVLAFNKTLVFDRTRLILYGVFSTLAVLSALISRTDFKVVSLFLALLIYTPMTVKLKISDKLYGKCIEMFQWFMVVICAVVLIEHVVQLLASSKAVPNMEKLLPASMLFPGYTYLRPMEWASKMIKPNGFFMLEVSIVSQFLALAIILELLYAQKAWRLVLFSVVLLSTFAGTGPLMLLIILPFMFFKTSPRVVAGCVLAALAVVIFSVQTGWLDTLLKRADEYQTYGQSSYHRFVEPLLKLEEFSRSENNLFYGEGPGNIYNAKNIVWWPITKVAVEYGFIVAAAFYAFVGYAMFKRPPDRRVALACFISYNLLNGSFAVPLNVFLCVMFCTIFEVEKKRTRSRRRRSAWSMQNPASETADVRPVELG